MEYLGLVLVVVAIVGALVATGVGAELTRKIVAQVECIGGGSCESGGGGDPRAGDGGDGRSVSDDDDDGGGADTRKSPEQVEYEKALKELQDA
ncbi:hypothetical protein ABZ611_25910, partial [Streptomyces sp. NPDC007861]|uniref:hypothetical protein n=1 Tax=Streptomyces sp. NPDC007861 TaxID=3154893 RepID=UPI0033FE21D6